MGLFHRYSRASNSFANPSYVEEEDEFVDESSKKTSSLMKSSNMEMFMMMLNMKMSKILHKDSWIGILSQPMISISLMKILWVIFVA